MKIGEKSFFGVGNPKLLKPSSAQELDLFKIQPILWTVDTDLMKLIVLVDFAVRKFVLRSGKPRFNRIFCSDEIFH